VRGTAKRKFWGVAFALAFFFPVFVLGCGVFYRYDAPRAVIDMSGAEVWAVSLSASGRRYHVTSTTRLNGQARLHEQPTASIATGTVGDWQWTVMAVPSVVPSWRAWQEEKRNTKVRQEAIRSGNWLHSAAGWDLAFQRARRVAQYLLGRPPLPFHATLLLLPEGVRYNKRISEAGKGYVPLTLAFYWPNSKRPAAFIGVVTRTMYEYQHLLVDSGFISPVGNGKGDRTANDEARSQCWSDSTFLALEAGTPSSVQWKVSQARAALALLDQSNQQKVNGEGGQGLAMPEVGPIRYSDAYMWGRFFEVESVAAYLRSRGDSTALIHASDPAQVNALLSVCRAMTQQPRDLTKGPYPASQVEYVPFFPKEFK